MPVEHRFLGLDKRSFPYGLVAIGVFLIATVLVPRLDGWIDWDDPVRAGDQLATGDGLAFVPATGWEVISGFRVGEANAGAAAGSAKITGNGVVFDITYDAFDGTPSELLEQIAKVTSGTGDETFTIDGEPATVTTRAGDVGVIQAYSSANGDGLIAAFVINGTGLEVTAYGAPAQMAAAADTVHAMITSIHEVEGSDS
ncbi:hypothetical protein ACFV9G_13770 [Nocardioides sp. NPDC059952]|uniref:hypothetical protein n=1 Tax=Nocardioides sp. NPDC059952 TaxID=3347014 RepID=UPI00364DC027